jgi:DNA modification methylase
MDDGRVTIYHGDSRQVLENLPDESVHCVVTSPPYWGLRDYGENGQMGMEETPAAFIAGMVELFGQVRRVLRTDGTLWLNMGDSYCGTGSKGAWKDPKHPKGRNGQVVAVNNKIEGLKQKDLCGIPWRLALALQADGWWLRQDIIWHKPNPMPESVTDRCTKAHEYVFLMTKAARYYYDADAVREKPTTAGLRQGGDGYSWHDHENTAVLGNRQDSAHNGKFCGVGGRNRRSVWTIPTAPYPGAHFATFPPALVQPCIKAGCPEGGTVLDPFMGSGTTGDVALRHSCKFIGIELSEEYIQLAMKRFDQKVLF